MKADKFIAILLEEEPFDPDQPADQKAELNRMFPTKTVRLRGNSMLCAPGIVSAVQAGWKSKSRKQKKWAYDVLHAWEGLKEEDYIAILTGNCTIKAEGDDAVIVVKLWKK